MDSQPVNTSEPAGKAPLQKNLALVRQVTSGANWFFWIAGLSLINSIIHLAGVSSSFLIGLALTQLIDILISASMTSVLGGSYAVLARLVSFGADLIVVGVFVIFGILGRKRYGSVMMLGLVLYVLDGILLLLDGQFPAVIFHGIAVLGIWRGVQASRKLNAMRASEPTGAGDAQPQTFPSQAQPQLAHKPKRKITPLQIGLGAGATLLCCGLLACAGLFANLYSNSVAGTARWVRSVRWSPDGSRFAVGSADKSVSLWDTNTWKQIWTNTDHQSYVRGLSWSPDNALLASGDGMGTIMLHDPQTGRRLQVLTEGEDSLGYVAWSPDGNRLASAGANNGVDIWDAKGKQKILTSSSKHNGSITGVVWSPDGSRLATSSADSRVIIWDVASGEAVYTMTGHSGWVNDLAWSPDGKRLASGGDDSTLILWNPETGELLSRFNGHKWQIYGVAWSPDGTRLASASTDNHVIVWDPQTGRPIISLVAGSAAFITVAWSPDGAWLTAGTEKNTVIVWETKTWTQIRELRLDSPAN